ncbi:putative Transcriptional regulator, LuxR family [metagenome]|uniref:Putative Transcriptional regulator, LuxR family n=1 Tax=metagenome TaxID=256318 RepID=A0A2P2C722_9ZZZZ
MSLGGELADAGTGSALPFETTSFVGRRAEATAVTNMLGETRHLTLVGPGGIGKTRLALRVAAEASDSFEDGVRLVKLGDVVDPSLLVTKVGEALGVQGRSTDHLMEQLVTALSGRQLLVLDNCEHIVEAVASLLNGILPRTRDLRVLATSRQSLGIAFERSWQVPPMAVPDLGPDKAREGLRACLEEAEAVTLFLDRSDALTTATELPGPELEAAFEICRRLDGLPLAIELAAIRTRSLSFQQVLALMDDRFELLTVGHRGAEARQVTLRSLIDWSYELCTPNERALWLQVSVFAGGFDLDAVRHVCVTGAESVVSLVDLIDALLDKSILIAERSGPVMRYRMLETIRAYGEELVERAGDWHDLRRRHRDYFRSLTTDWRQRWIGPDQAEICAAAEREWANLQVGLEFSTSQAGEGEAALDMASGLFFIYVKSAAVEGGIWFARALEADPSPTLARARALWGSAFLSIGHGDFASPRPWVDECRTIAVALGDLDTLEAERAVRAWLEIGRGDVSGALAALDVDGVQPEGHFTRQLRAIAMILAGDFTTAEGVLEASVRICAPKGEVFFRSHALNQLTYVAWQFGEAERVRALAAETIQLHQTLDDRLGIGHSLEHAAWVATDDVHGAQLLGASHHILSELGAALYAFLQPHHEHYVQRLTAALGERRFESAFAEGATLTIDRAIALVTAPDPALRRPARPERPDGLTPREAEIATMVAQGMTNRGIAETLVISPRTVETHVEHVLAKLGLVARGQVAPRLAALGFPTGAEPA